jgi:hypothetical protein
VRVRTQRLHLVAQLALTGCLNTPLDAEPFEFAGDGVDVLGVCGDTIGQAAFARRCQSPLRRLEPFGELGPVPFEFFELLTRGCPLRLYC